VQRIYVGIGINRQGSNPELFARADNAQRNFTAIGNQDFLKHWLRVFG
jgi:hypothetical protein